MILPYADDDYLLFKKNSVYFKATVCVDRNVRLVYRMLDNLSTGSGKRKWIKRESVYRTEDYYK